MPYGPLFRPSKACPQSKLPSHHYQCPIHYDHGHSHVNTYLVCDSELPKRKAPPWVHPVACSNCATTMSKPGSTEKFSREASCYILSKGLLLHPVTRCNDPAIISKPSSTEKFSQQASCLSRSKRQLLHSLARSNGPTTISKPSSTKNFS